MAELIKVNGGFPSQNRNPQTDSFEEAYSDNNTPWVQDKQAHTKIQTLTDELNALKQLIIDQQAGTKQASVRPVDGNGDGLFLQSRPGAVTDEAAHTKLDNILNKLNDKINTEVTGSLMGYAGNTLSEAPTPSSVPIGAEYTDIENEIIYKNTGTEWKQWVVL